MFGRNGSDNLKGLSFCSGAELSKNRAELSRSIVSLGGTWHLNKSDATNFILVN